jgi:hypothetical protein
MHRGLQLAVWKANPLLRGTVYTVFILDKEENKTSEFLASALALLQGDVIPPCLRTLSSSRHFSARALIYSQVQTLSSSRHFSIEEDDPDP